MAELSGKIKSLEDLRQKANDKLRTSRDAVAAFRDRRDRISAEKADLDDKLNVINKAVETKKDALQRLKTNFFVASEEALDHQVKYWAFLASFQSDQICIILGQNTAARIA